jgi:hypothetical protein
MVIETIVAAAFFVGCTFVMGRVFGMLDMCVPSSPEPEAKARARRWKQAVAAVVVGAWVSAACIVFGFHMSKVPCMVVCAGAFTVSVPVIVWVLLVY